MEQKTIDLEFVNQLRQKMQGQQIMFSYRGGISHEVMLALLAMTEKKLEMEGSDQSMRNKVFNVLVECMQNITMQCENDTSGKAPIFMIGRNCKGYCIYSGSPVKSDKVMSIKNSLLKINTMSKDELKEFHRIWLQSIKNSTSGDVSLGLIDIARKTGNKLEFEFEPINSDHYYFSLRTAISNPS